MADLENLSPIDFEDLCRDLAKALTGERFEAFGPGPDGGMDGRHSKAGRTIILQCKHYIRSSFSDLKRSLNREVNKVRKLKPVRYILFTSHSLTSVKKNEIIEIFRGLPLETGDVFGGEDVHALLRVNPDIHKSHIKLWLSSTAVLERVLNSGLESFTNATKEEILEELRLYVRNPSFDEAIKRLEDQKVIIISGPPGVGKTTLARMLTYHYLNDEWRFYAINSLEEGFSKVEEANPTIFFFDDFLGRIELDRQALRQHDSSLALFVKRIQNSKNARFILTTRAHIFEEAKSVSDYIDERNVQLTRYLLDVGKYTRRVKAHIFFNHLACSDLTEEHFASLLSSGLIKSIVDHQNYNPRVISQVTSQSVDPITPQEFPQYVLGALSDPGRIWQKPFAALEPRSKHFLFTLFFANQFGESIDSLRVSFNALHKLVSDEYSQSREHSDFDVSLKNLESGFISISGQDVSFVNPSVRDFLKGYLVDVAFVKLLPKAAMRADWARDLWRHGKQILNERKSDLKEFSDAFLEFSKRIDHYPTLQPKRDGYLVRHVRDDLALADRVDLLVELAFESKNTEFFDAAITLLGSGRLTLIPDRDAKSGIELHRTLESFLDKKSSYYLPLLEGVEGLIVSAIEGGLNTEDLVSVIQELESCFGDVFPDAIHEAIDEAVEYELNHTEDAISHIDSEDALSDQLTFLDELEELTGRDATKARDVVSQKLQYYERPEDDERAYTGYRGGAETNLQSFDDAALDSLFSNLVRK